MKEFDKLVDVVNKLRDPQNGCPWDLKQTPESLIPNFIEELYEAIEAIHSKDQEHLSEELGDIMLHILMQIKMASEKNEFTIEKVLNKISNKLISRHPHIFGDKKISDPDMVKLNWELLKQKEKKHTRESVIDGIPKSMPGLIVAQRMQEKAASVGFDWNNEKPVFDKLKEEVQELDEALKGLGKNEIEEELGDVLFTIVNLSRKLKIDAETALKKSSDKFEKRFKKLEKYHKNNNEDIYENSLERLDEIWEIVKKEQ